MFDPNYRIQQSENSVCSSVKQDVADKQSSPAEIIDSQPDPSKISSNSKASGKHEGIKSSQS